MIFLGIVLSLLNATMIVVNLREGYMKSWKDVMIMAFYVMSLFFISNYTWKMILEV